MTNDKKPDTTAINSWFRTPRNSRRFTIVHDDRSKTVRTITSDGETFEGRDGINDALYRTANGAEPRNRRDDDDDGGAA